MTEVDMLADYSDLEEDPTSLKVSDYLDTLSGTALNEHFPEINYHVPAGTHADEAKRAYLLGKWKEWWNAKNPTARNLSEIERLRKNGLHTKYFACCAWARRVLIMASQDDAYDLWRTRYVEDDFEKDGRFTKAVRKTQLNKLGIAKLKVMLALYEKKRKAENKPDLILEIIEFEYWDMEDDGFPDEVLADEKEVKKKKKIKGKVEVSKKRKGIGQGESVKSKKRKTTRNSSSDQKEGEGGKKCAPNPRKLPAVASKKPTGDGNDSESSAGEKVPPAAKKGGRGRMVNIKSSKLAKPTEKQIEEFEEIEKLIVDGVCINPKKYRAGANMVLYNHEGVGLETAFDSMGPPGCGFTGEYTTTGFRVNVADLFGTTKENYEKWMKSKKLGEEAAPGKEDWKSEKIKRMQNQVCHLVDPNVDNVYACVHCLNNFVHIPEPGRTLYSAGLHKCPTDATKKKGSSWRMVEQYKQFKNGMGKKSEEEVKMELIEKSTKLIETTEELQTTAKELEMLKTKEKEMKANEEMYKARIEEMEKLLGEKDLGVVEGNKKSTDIIGKNLTAEKSDDKNEGSKDAPKGLC